MRKIIFILLGLLFIGSLYGENLYVATRVIDGDTIVIDNKKKIRLIGVDTPETVHPSKSVEYFGKEATLFTKRICEGKIVRLEYDWQRYDKYGRTLAYVYLEDGTFINAEIIKQGYGFVYTRFPFKYIDEFREYQRKAMENGRGLWGKTIHNPEVSSLIMNYEKLNEEGRQLLEEYVEDLNVKKEAL